MNAALLLVLVQFCNPYFGNLGADRGKCIQFMSKCVKTWPAKNHEDEATLVCMTEWENR